MPSSNPPETDRVQLLARRQPQLSDVYDAEHDAFFCPDVKPLSADLDGRGMTTVVIDTGLLSRHPMIAPRLVGEHDLTGEGPEDWNGHGTRVALLLACYVPGGSLFNLKAVGRAAGGRQVLVDALDWFAQNDVGPSGGGVTANLSAGVYTPSCTGHCEVCSAARRVAAAGRVITVAAGNWHGVTACPAKASDAVITVAEVDALTGQLTPTSSPATSGGSAAPSPGQVPGTWVVPGA